jgi:hypothetical protein
MGAPELPKPSPGKLSRSLGMPSSETDLHTKVIGRTVSRNNCTYILPLHVLAFAGHPHAEYTIFWGSYLSYIGSGKYLPETYINKIYN